MKGLQACRQHNPIVNVCAIDAQHFCRRYAAGYPHDPINLRLLDVSGLSTADARGLSKALHASAEAHAREDAVCVFDLVDACQDFLRARNVPAAADTEPVRPFASYV